MWSALSFSEATEVGCCRVQEWRVSVGPEQAESWLAGLCQSASAKAERLHCWHEGDPSHSRQSWAPQMLSHDVKGQ